MKTLVYPPPSGIGHTAYVGVVARQLTQAEAFTIALDLAQQELWVLPEIEHGVLNLRPMHPVDAPGERDILAAFEAVTDMRVAWRGKPTPIRPSCLLCGVVGVVLEHDLCGRCSRPFQAAAEVAPC